VLAKAAPGLRLCDHLDDDGAIVFRHACKLGARTLARPPVHFRPHPPLAQAENPAAPAVKRETEEDWGKNG
jgi:hypothetical protein